MQRLIDVNVVCRVAMNDIGHPRYTDAVQMLSYGGCIRTYTLPEIMFQLLASVRRSLASEKARRLGELELFNAAPRKYTASITPPSGWKKEAYKKCQYKLDCLLSDYAEVEVEDKPLYDAAMQIAIQTGYDWVDCLLLAEEKLGRGTISSIDIDITKGRSGLNTMSLT